MNVFLFDRGDFAPGDSFGILSSLWLAARLGRRKAGALMNGRGGKQAENALNQCVIMSKTNLIQSLRSYLIHPAQRS
jgi:hypothetical protein